MDNKETTGVQTKTVIQLCQNGSEASQHHLGTVASIP